MLDRVSAGHHFDHPEWDGYIGVVVSLWLVYLGFEHAREALVPILGQAPSKALIQKIREAALSVEHVEGAHEVAVHDYGAMMAITVHLEIPERLGPAKMHEVTEKCEARLRNEFGGSAVCHTDPLIEHGPEVRAVEDVFAKVVEGAPRVVDYHDFRVVDDSPDTIIIVAHLDADEHAPENEYPAIAADLEARVKDVIPNVAYCAFDVTPKFSY